MGLKIETKCDICGRWTDVQFMNMSGVPGKSSKIGYDCYHCEDMRNEAWMEAQSRDEQEQAIVEEYEAKYRY